MKLGVLLASIFCCTCYSLGWRSSLSHRRLGFRKDRYNLIDPLPHRASSLDDVGAESRLKKKTPRNPANGAYDKEQWGKAFVSQPEEFDYFVADDSIEGVIPADLCGSLFRNRPGLFERGGQPYGHYLDGDGYITRVTIKNGKAHFLSKFVRTEEFIAEEKAEKVLYRSTFRTKPKSAPMNFFGLKIDLNNILDLKLKNQANTNILYWGGKLLTFFEAGLPHRIDPSTFDTIGTDDMNVDIKSGVAVAINPLKSLFPALHDRFFGSFASAHPKIDEERDVMISWVSHHVISPRPEKLLATYPAVKIFEWDKEFKPIGPPVEYAFKHSAVPPHDFSFTENYYVFVEYRVEENLVPYLMGTHSPANCMDLQSQQPMLLHLVPRPQPHGLTLDAPPKVPIVIPLTPGFTLHSACAFEKDRFLELYTSAWKVESVMAGAVKGGLLGNWEGAVLDFDDAPPTILYHSKVDLRTGELVHHKPATHMESTTIEAPLTNPKYQGKEARYLYMCLGGNNGLSSPYIGYLRLDVLTGKKQEWFAPLHSYCEEVVIVPKKGTKGQAEDGVWVLGSMFDSKKNKACVGIFDGSNIAKGPVATIWMSHAMPHSLHGSFEPSTFIDM